MGEGALRCYDLCMPEISEKLSAYLDSLVPTRHPVLQEMEAYAKEHDFPIIGPACGHLCYLVARMRNAKRIFELGSGYGYSTAWFCKAVQENGGGEVHHVVWDKDLSEQAHKHLGDMGYGGIVRYTMGEAVQTLRDTPGPFDLIFNDIDKHAYPESLDVIEEKLAPGGVLIIDNMIWSGKIWDESDQTPATQGIREFTRRITTSSLWAASLIPIRDGMIVAMRT